MPDTCPDCEMQSVDGFICGCGPNECGVEAFVSGDGGQPGEKLREAIQDEVKVREEAIERTKKAIRELLGRKMELSTSSIDWLKAFHAHEFVAYEPKGVVVKEPEGELAEKSVEEPLHKRIFTSVALIALLGLVLSIVWPIVALIVVIAAIVSALFYTYVAYRYVRWFSPYVVRSMADKALLAVEAQKLEVEIEALRQRYAAEQEQARLTQERLKRASDSPTAGTEKSDFLNTARAEAAMSNSASGGNSKRPKGILGLIQAAANVLPVGKCPNCQASFAEVSDGEEILDTKSVLVRLPIEDDLFEDETVVEQAITKAKKSRCKRCGHRWRQVSEESQKLRGACPTCFGTSGVRVEGVEVLNTTGVALGGGPEKNNFRGRPEVRVRQEYLNKLHCSSCDRRWRHKAVRRWTLTGVCPACYSDRKILILKHKVDSQDNFFPVKHQDVHVDRNGLPIGGTVRQEVVGIRRDHYEATYQCRSCSHEWKECSSEEYRAY